MRHNHVTRDIKAPGECPACDEQHGVRPVSTRYALSADEVRRWAGEVDLLTWAETNVLRELVSSVHSGDMVGLSWPTVERTPMTLRNGELRETEPGQNVYEWRVTASVKAMPR